MSSSVAPLGPGAAGRAWPRIAAFLPQLRDRQFYKVNNAGNRTPMLVRTMLLALLTLMLPASAQAQTLNGTYTSDRAGMEQQATITPNGSSGYSVRLSVSAERCVGKLDATGRMQGNALVASPPKPDDGCRITIRKTASGISIDEDKCLYFHGAACEFSGPYSKK